MTLRPIGEIPLAILAGGIASRMHPVTERIPKALIRVAGRPFIDHQLELFRHKGFRKVVICVGFLGDMTADHVGDGARFGLQVRYSHDGDQLLGTAGAIRKARDSP